MISVKMTQIALKQSLIFDYKILKRNNIMICFHVKRNRVLKATNNQFDC